MTSKRAAARADAARMIDIESRLAPFFLRQHGVVIDEPAETPAPKLNAPTRKRRVTPLRPAPV